MRSAHRRRPGRTGHGRGRRYRAGSPCCRATVCPPPAVGPCRGTYDSGGCLRLAIARRREGDKASTAMTIARRPSQSGRGAAAARPRPRGCGPGLAPPPGPPRSTGGPRELEHPVMLIAFPSYGGVAQRWRGSGLDDRGMARGDVALAGILVSTRKSPPVRSRGCGFDLEYDSSSPPRRAPRPWQRGWNLRPGGRIERRWYVAGQDDPLPAGRGLRVGGRGGG